MDKIAVTIYLTDTLTETQITIQDIFTHADSSARGRRAGLWIIHGSVLLLSVT